MHSPEFGEYRYTDVQRRDSPEFQRLALATKAVSQYIDLNLPRAGIGFIYPGTLEHQIGISAAEVERAYDELAGDGSRPWHVAREGFLVWVVSRLEREPGLKLTVPNHRRAVQIHCDTLPDSELVTAFRERYSAWFAEPDGDGPGSSDSQAPARHGETHNPTHAQGMRKGLGNPSSSTIPCGADALHSGAERKPARARDDPHRSAPLSAGAGPPHENPEPVVLQPGLFRGELGENPERSLPPEALELLERFYPPGRRRDHDARHQLLQALTPEGARIDRHRGRVSGTREQLADACLEILDRPPHDEQLAVRFVLLRLQSRLAVVRSPPATRRQPDPAEEEAREEYNAEYRNAIDSWRLEHADEMPELEARYAALFAGLRESGGFRQAWLDGEIQTIAQFPSFRDWYRERQRTIRTPSPAKAAARELGGSE